jgi:hypothetical protein
MMMGGMITCDENDKATTVPNSKRQREFFLESEKVFLYIFFCEGRIWQSLTTPSVLRWGGYGFYFSSLVGAEKKIRLYPCWCHSW